MEKEYEFKVCLTEDEAFYFTETGSDYDSWIVFIGVLQKIRKSIRDQAEEGSIYTQSP